MYRFMFKDRSDHYVLFCHDPLSHLAIDASSCINFSPKSTNQPKEIVLTICNLICRNFFSADERMKTGKLSKW